MINLNLDVVELVEEAKCSISDFCIDSCKADCCKNRHVFSKREEDVRIFFEIPKEMGLEEFSFIHPRRLEKIENRLYIVHYPCNHFNNNKCDIHEDLRRPTVCKEYPMRASYDKDGFPFVEYTTECKAVQKGLFNRVLDVLRENYVLVLCTR